MYGSPVLLFLDISGGELLVIMLVVFLVFGPEKMPEMARKAGRLMNQMKKASSDLTREFKKETSVLQNEITAVQSKVKDQVESVNREFNRTKSQVTTAMNIEDTKPAVPVESAKPPEVSDPNKQITEETPKPENDTIKTE
ncbi:MAG: twin-arginine translocase TatA/TatE family subunit [Bacteroidales bacterium]|nr:twin-arginine translocase TatA/TatE family subunit [Bacteroidales bacterium]